MTKLCSTTSCSRPVLGRGLCPSHYSAWHRAQKKYTIECITCGVEKQVARSGMKYCSRRCANLTNIRMVHPHAMPKPMDIVLYTGVKATPRLPRPTPARRFTAGMCKTCAVWFISTKPCVTCSLQCQIEWKQSVRRAKNKRHTMRKRDAYVQDVNPARVFEADGWRCHICGGKLVRTAQVPHPKAPTVDHVIPLNQGGTHEPANCRAAHFECNSRKSDRTYGDQMLLLAV